jgi:hypothetical protein
VTKKITGSWNFFHNSHNHKLKLMVKAMHKKHEDCQPTPMFLNHVAPSAFDAPSYSFPLNVDMDKLCLTSIISKDAFKEGDLVSTTCITPSNLSKTSPFRFANLQARPCIISCESIIKETSKLVFPIRENKNV